MFSKRVIKKGVIMEYTSYSNHVVREHKRNSKILTNVLLIVDMNNIKHHVIKLNKYHKHISCGMFSNISITRCYKLNKIQLRVLYNNLLHNSYIK